MRLESIVKVSIQFLFYREAAEQGASNLQLQLVAVVFN
jgi:hypothetical protein